MECFLISQHSCSSDGDTRHLQSLCHQSKVYQGYQQCYSQDKRAPCSSLAPLGLLEKKSLLPGCTSKFVPTSKGDEKQTDAPEM